LTSNRLLGLWRMMTGFRLTYLAASLSLGIAAVSKTGTYLVIRYYVDHVLGMPGRSATLPLIAGVIVALALFEGGFTFLSGRLAARTAEGIALRLRDYLFDHIQRLPFAYHDRAQTGDLIERSTSDVDAQRRFFADQATTAGRIVLLFLVNLVALLSLDWRLGLISIAAVPLIIALSLVFFRRISKAYEAYQEQEARLSTALQENLTGVRVVKAFARQDYERRKFDRENWEKYLRGRRLMTMHALFWPISDVVCGLQMLGGFVFAAQLAIRAEITMGTYLAYAGMVVWLIFPLRNLARLIVQMSTGLVSFSRVAEVIRVDREPLVEGSAHPRGNLSGHVVFRDVAFAYEGSSRVLKDISFEVFPGQVVALLGATGSGKSTLVNLLPRFYEYSGGSLQIDGLEVRDIPRQILRQQIGIVEQEPFLFSRTIRENITYGVGREVPQAEIEAAAQAAAIHTVILDSPGGYDTLVGEKGVTLSGGQKQRVAIARTLLKDPRILILDDSTSSVDTETEEAIWEALERLMQGRTTFVIAHRIQTVMRADLILVLERGSIVQRGTHQDLLAQPGIYRQIFDVQARIEVELHKEVERASV
jgi:ATP-binding cassette subfamily B protein